MCLNELEKQILQKFLDDKCLDLIKRDINFDLISINYRELTGAGFLTEFKRCDKLKVTHTTQSYMWKKVGAKLNSNHDTEYLIYVENGHLNAIEGWTYSDSWPDEVSQIEIYETDIQHSIINN